MPFGFVVLYTINTVQNLPEIFSSGDYMFDPAEIVDKAKVMLLKKITPHQPEAALILGTGLNEITAGTQALRIARYDETPGLAMPQVPGHSGEIRLVEIGGLLFIAFCGRSHLYEGYDPQYLGMQVRIARALGITKLVSVCASGSLREDLAPGTIVLVEDHLNMAGVNPLVGTVISGRVIDFPDATKVYSEPLLNGCEAVAKHLDLACRRGVYAWVSGPSFETKAESRMLRCLGADVVGMSLVPESLVASQLGLDMLALACVTNYSPPDNGEHDHGAVINRARDFVKPVRQVLERMREYIRV
jgi:purine-nucleoside phosphorylase